MHTIAKKDYRIGFTATALLSIGGFMMMPFGSAFAINNLHITENELPLLFMISGLATLIAMPLIGKLSDKINKFKIFTFGSLWTMAIVGIYTNLSATPFIFVAVFNVMMMMGIMGRMIPSIALVTSIPEMQDRGAFMSINSSLQQIAGGIAATFAGTIVIQKNKLSPLEHYDTLGIIIIGISILTIVLMYRVNTMINRKNREKKEEHLFGVQEIQEPI